MLFAIRNILIFFTIFCHCNGYELYKEAEAVAAEKNFKNEKLYEKYNATTSDYMHLMLLEIFGPSPGNFKTNILLEAQRLIKNQGRCKKRTFKHCLRDLAKSVPKKDKCQLMNGTCDSHEKYSRVDGSCNNLAIQNMGRANTPYNRLLRPAYSDGISEFRRTVDNKELPNPRIMGNVISKACRFKEDKYKCGDQINNFAGLMFSQMVAHDTSSRKVVTIKGNASDGMSCCASDYSAPLAPNQCNPSCIPVRLPQNDTYYAPKKIFCQSYVRLAPTLENDCSIKCEPENIVTSFLDLGVIYSNSDQEMQALRANCCGLFNMEPKNILPIQFGQMCAGDFRFSQTTILSIMHSLMYRFHNMNAELLATLNPCWSNDKVFFESRRITIASYQHIIYYEWLPLVLGKKRCESYKLICENYYESCHLYDPSENPTTMIEYGMNAFRWFHTNIPKNQHAVNDDCELVEEVPLSDTYLNLDLINTKYNWFLAGAMQQKQRMHQVGYTGQVRNLFVKNLYHGEKVGVDGFLLDVMRSRDSGTAPYIDYYVFCLSKRIECWEDLKPYFEWAHFELLRQLYKNVKDIDLMVGMLLEKRCGNWMGKISGCLVAEQFKRFKFGDRFFYSHSNNPHKFSPEQLYEIKKMTFSRLVCTVTDLNRVPRRGFVAISRENSYIECKKISPLNLLPFKERCSRSTSSSSSTASPSTSYTSSSSSSCLTSKSTKHPGKYH